MIVNAQIVLQTNRELKDHETPSIGGFHFISKNSQKAVTFDFCRSEMQKAGKTLQYCLEEPDTESFPDMETTAYADLQELFQDNELELDLYIDYDGCENDLQITYQKFLIECQEDDGRLIQCAVPTRFLERYHRQFYPLEES